MALRLIIACFFSVIVFGASYWTHYSDYYWFDANGVYYSSGIACHFCYGGKGWPW